MKSRSPSYGTLKMLWGILSNHKYVRHKNSPQLLGQKGFFKASVEDIDQHVSKIREVVCAY